KVGRQLSFLRKVTNVTNDQYQDAAAESADSSDAGEILVSFQLLDFLCDRLFKLSDALVQTADLIDDDLEFDFHKTSNSSSSTARKPFSPVNASLIRFTLCSEDRLLILFFRAVRSFTIVSWVCFSDAIWACVLSFMR